MYMQKEKSKKKASSLPQRRQFGNAGPIFHPSLYPDETYRNPHSPSPDLKGPIQLKREGAMALNKIRLHQMTSAGVEERDIKIMIPNHEPFIIDPEITCLRSTDGQPMVYAKYAIHEGYVKNLPDESWSILPARDGFDMIQSVYQMVEAHLLKAGITLKGWEVIQRHLTLCMGKEIPINPVIWEQTLWQIVMKAIPRIKRDLNIMKQNNLITANATRITQIELSGGDSHKMGQTPLFVTFDDGKRIVYKPNSLEMDAALFRQGGSAASQLSTQGGQQIPQYNILPLTEADTQDKYGYMEFIDSTVTPLDEQTKEEVFQIFRSIAANMAFSYFFGLADIHEENFILRREAFQLIDMEVVTGVYGNAVLGGWKRLLTNPAFTGKINMHLLTEADFTYLKVEMMKSFRAIYDKAAAYCIINDNVRPQLNQSSDLSAMQVRFVPFPTNYFYGQLTHAGRMNYQQWKTHIDNLQPYDALSPQIGMHMPQTTMTDITVKTILKAPCTYHALSRGEIPFYTKYTNIPDMIQDETGHMIFLTGETAPSVHSTMIPQVNSRWPGQTAAGGGLAQQLLKSSLFQPFWDIVHEAFQPLIQH